MCSISQWSILSLITSEVLIYHEHLVQGSNCLISKDCNFSLVFDSIEPLGYDLKKWMI